MSVQPSLLIHNLLFLSEFFIEQLKKRQNQKKHNGSKNPMFLLKTDSRALLSDSSL